LGLVKSLILNVHLLNFQRSSLFLYKMKDFAYIYSINNNNKNTKP
jgi:hypothetical protein